MLWRQQAALVAGTLTRVPSGGNLPPWEVMMSRPLKPPWPCRNKYVIFAAWHGASNTITELSSEQAILRLPPGLLARYLRLTDLMLEFGPNLGMPHTRAMGGGLFELRVTGQEGIARVFYCTVVQRRIVMLHVFIKKSQKTPKRELEIAKRRLQEVLRHAPR